MPAGPPSKYPTHVKPRLETIRAWKRDGLTDEQICENLKVSVDSFWRYKELYAELREVLKYGLVDHVAHVENAMAKRALGYTYYEIIRIKGTNAKFGDYEETKRIKKYQPPDVGAQIFILKNRRIEKWRDVYGQGDKFSDTGTLDELATAIIESRASVKSGGSDVG